MDRDIEKAFADREIAKGQWESFENDDPRFYLPRKNYKYVSRIVENEGNAPESIQRALDYFDRHDIWVLRAEAYQHIAKQLEDADREAVAHKVYGIALDALPGLELEPELHNREYGNFGEHRLDQAISMLNWAARTSRSTDLINRHREFMTEIFPGLVADMSSRRVDTELYVEYWQQNFEAPLNPEYYCAKNRITEQRLTDVELKMGYVTCRSCHAGLMLDEDVWQQVIEKPCLIESAE